MIKRIGDLARSVIFITDEKTRKIRNKIFLNKNDILNLLKGKDTAVDFDNGTKDVYTSDEYNSKISQITSFTGEKTYDSFEDADELNYVSAVGALLWTTNNIVLTDIVFTYTDNKSQIINLKKGLYFEYYLVTSKITTDPDDWFNTLFTYTYNTNVVLKDATSDETISSVTYLPSGGGKTTTIPQVLYYAKEDCSVYLLSDSFDYNNTYSTIYTKSLIVTNGDSTASDYWDPKSDTISTPTYYNASDYNGVIELIGVCCGYGKWVYTSWIGLTTTYTWAASSSDNLYKWHPTMVHGHGYENTMHVLENHSDILTGTLWEQVKSVRDSGMPIFIPSKYELLDCQENICDDNHSVQAEGSDSIYICSYTKNLGKLLSCTTNNYWSSSLDSTEWDYAFYCIFKSGRINHSDKTEVSRSLALLHFGN